MPVRYLVALTGAAVLIAFVLGYEKGADSVRQGVAAESVRISEQARQKEKDMQKKLNGITENYLHEIEEYKKTINAYSDVDINSLSDTRACPGTVPRKAENKPGFICYSAADIQRKLSTSGLSLRRLRLRCRKYGYCRRVRRARHQANPVFISEYTMPEDRFVPVAAFTVKRKLNTKKSSICHEKIWRPRTQL